MPGLIVPAKDFQAEQVLNRAFPKEIPPLYKALSGWEGSEEGTPPLVGFAMIPGGLVAKPFDLTVSPWIGTFQLFACGRGDAGVQHEVPAFICLAKFHWHLLKTYTTGKLPPMLFDLEIGAVEKLWTARAVQANEAVKKRINNGLRLL